MRNDVTDKRHMSELADDNKLEQFKWEGNPPEPTCPSCKCICNKLYRVKDIMSITVAIKQNKMRGMMNSGPSPSAMLAQFIGQSITAGRQAADDIVSMQKKRQSSTVGITDDLIKDLFWDALSEYVSRMAGSLSSYVVELLHVHLPKGSKIVLPGGRKYDARGRVIARNAKNMHLTVPKQKRTEHQSKERAIAKRFDAELRYQPATDKEIGTVLASSMDISVSQISEWESGEVNSC